MIFVYFSLEFKNCGLTPYSLVNFVYAEVIELNLKIPLIENDGFKIFLFFRPLFDWPSYCQCQSSHVFFLNPSTVCQ